MEQIGNQPASLNFSVSIERKKMKKEIPDGEYVAALEHHPNQKPLNFIATIAEGEFAGKRFNVNLGILRCVDLVCEEENEN